MNKGLLITIIGGGLIVLLTAIDDMMKHKESHANILNPELTHVGTGIAVGNGKVVMVFDFEV